MPRVPEPSKGGSYKHGYVGCKHCGTNTFNNLEEMLNHQSWCNAAKKKKDAAEKSKKARSNNVKHRR